MKRVGWDASCETLNRSRLGEVEERMAMTGVVKDELSRLPVLKPCCRKAEVSTLLRFASGLHLVGGREAS